MVTRRWRPVNSASLLLLCHSHTRYSLHTLASQGTCSHPDHHEVLMSPCPASPTAPTLRGQLHPLLCLGSPSSWEFGGSGLDVWLSWQPGSGPLDRRLTLGPHQCSLAFWPTEMRTDSSSQPLCTEESHAPVVDQERLSVPISRLPTSKRELSIQRRRKLHSSKSSRQSREQECKRACC